MRKIFVLQEDNTLSETLSLWAKGLSEAFNHEIATIIYNPKDSSEQFAARIEEADASLVLIELTNRGKSQLYLNLCSALRVPYLFVFPNVEFAAKRLSVPITFLVEDKEKIPFASAFGRFCHSEIIIYKPKDYGDGAQETINQAQTLFDSFGLHYTVHQAKKGSYDVEREAVRNAVADGASFVIVSASRQYGLDDIIFGPKERKILKTTEVPIMLINPRADLYTLCD